MMPAVDLTKTARMSSMTLKITQTVISDQDLTEEARMLGNGGRGVGVSTDLQTHCDV